jgi:hypothetical protein
MMMSNDVTASTLSNTIKHYAGGAAREEFGQHPGTPMVAVDVGEQMKRPFSSSPALGGVS